MPSDSNEALPKDVQPLEVIEPTTTTQDTEAEANYPTGAKFWLLILSVSLVLILGGMDGNIVATALPSITDHFHTVADVGWYSAAYRLSTCSFKFMFGKMYTIFSVKWGSMVSIFVFLIGSILSATAPTSKMSVFGRAVTGFSACGIISGCFTLLLQVMPLRKRPVFAGVLGAVEGAAAVAALILEAYSQRS